MCYVFVSSLGGEYLPTTANKMKSSDKLKMRRTLMDSYNETVRSAPKVKEKDKEHRFLRVGVGRIQGVRTGPASRRANDKYEKWLLS